jgi:hypothetical protein
VGGESEDEESGDEESEDEDGSSKGVGAKESEGHSLLLST